MRIEYLTAIAIAALVAGTGLARRHPVDPLPYEDIYLKGYSDGHEAKAGIARWIEFYNFQRPHHGIDGGSTAPIGGRQCHRRDAHSVGHCAQPR